jgi:hypothetical protein
VRQPAAGGVMTALAVTTDAAAGATTRAALARPAVDGVTTAQAVTTGVATPGVETVAVPGGVMTTAAVPKTVVVGGTRAGLVMIGAAATGAKAVAAVRTMGPGVKAGSAAGRRATPATVGVAKTGVAATGVTVRPTAPGAAPAGATVPAAVTTAAMAAQVVEVRRAAEVGLTSPAKADGPSVGMTTPLAGKGMPTTIAMVGGGTESGDATTTADDLTTGMPAGVVAQGNGGMATVGLPARARRLREPERFARVGGRTRGRTDGSGSRVRRRTG